MLFCGLFFNTSRIRFTSNLPLKQSVFAGTKRHLYLSYSRWVFALTARPGRLP